MGKLFTNRETLSIDRYFSKIGKVELLDLEAEVILVKKIKHATPQE
jgi:hypothetical protein